MAIITISRGSASGGILLAEGLGEKLGYKLVSREDVVHEAARFGALEEELQDTLLKPPGFWDRMRHKRRRYLTFIRLALCEKAKDDNIVYHGNAGQFLMPQDCPILRVRLVAPVEFRVHMLRQREGMSREDAIDYIKKIDEQRKKWSEFLYGVDLIDPHLYDLMLNLHFLDIEGAVEVIVAAARRAEFTMTDKARQSFLDHLLAARVEAYLAANHQTADLEVKIEAHQGEVFLNGRLASAADVESVLRVTGEVEGVKKIDREGLDAFQPLV